jgi:hypothetical protein
MDINTPRRPAPAPARPPVGAVPATGKSPEKPAPTEESWPSATQPATASPASPEKTAAAGLALAPDFSGAPSLPVHEAPQSDDAEQSAGQQTSSPTDQPADTSQPEEAIEPTQAPAANQTLPRDKSPLPVGAIVTTVFVMLVLSAAAILVYIKT